MFLRHRAGDARAPYLVRTLHTQTLQQVRGHLPVIEDRGGQGPLVDHPHQAGVLLGLTLWRVAKKPARNRAKLALLPRVHAISPMLLYFLSKASAYF